MTTSKETLLARADRCEAATEQQQAELLREAFSAIHGPQLGVDGRTNFERMLTCGAFESAAMALVPEGWDANLHYHFHAPNDRHLAVLTDKAWLDEADNGRLVEGNAATLALALCAAALRARAAMIGATP